jgi:hypothetical protein
MSNVAGGQKAPRVSRISSDISWDEGLMSSSTPLVAETKSDSDQSTATPKIALNFRMLSRSSPAVGTVTKTGSNSDMETALPRFYRSVSSDSDNDSQVPNRVRVTRIPSDRSIDDALNTLSSKKKKKENTGGKHNSHLLLFSLSQTFHRWLANRSLVCRP